MIFDCPTRFRRAVKLRAAMEDTGTTEIILEALAAFLPDELQKADEHIAKGKPERKAKPGRKPPRGND